MEPMNKANINGMNIEEFYWNGKMVVYVDGVKFEGSFEEAKKSADALVKLGGNNARTTT